MQQLIRTGTVPASPIDSNITVPASPIDSNITVPASPIGSPWGFYYNNGYQTPFNEIIQSSNLLRQSHPFAKPGQWFTHIRSSTSPKSRKMARKININRGVKSLTGEIEQETGKEGKFNSNALQILMRSSRALPSAHGGGKKSRKKKRKKMKRKTRSKRRRRSLKHQRDTSSYNSHVS